ncbi:hypothetical protein DOY81_004715 [Sarcophaga bullata]|nr:hypothetical protein DOY81_004715 [Sarcophaga bullata]
MGLTYQDFKRLGINSIVLEKQENIEIQQNSSSYSRKQRRLIRERFYKDRCQEVFNEYNKYKEPSHGVGGIRKFYADRPEKTYEFKDYSKRISSIRDVLLHSIGLEEEKQREFEHKVDETSSQLEYLELAINHEIEKLQPQSSEEIRMENKMERKEEAADITWAENFASNCLRGQRSQNMAKEKFSLQHQGVSMSPRYGSNPDVALRPKTRSVGSQIASFIRGMDKGAKGDHNSYNSLKTNKIPDCYYGLKDVLLTPSIHRQHDEYVNCCFPNASVNPAQTCCCATRPPTGLVCHHHNFQQSGVQPYGQYNYCRDEYYYDCCNCDKKPQTTTCCQQKANGRNTKKGYGRHGTDLNTEEFYCRPKSRSSSKSKERKKEACGDQGGRHKRSTSQAKSDKSKGKSSEELKLEKICRETGSKLVKHLDRYADDYKKRMDGFLNKQQNGESKAREVSSTTTTGTIVKISSASNVCRITVHRKHNHHNNEKSTENAGSESPYSLETLRMLKKMKIRKYVAAKPRDKHKEKDRNSLDNRLEKLKNYYDYLEKYKKDEKTNKLKGSSNETLKILKEPPTVFEESRSEKMLQQQRLLESFPGEESHDKSYGYRPESNDETDSYQRGNRKSLEETEIEPQPSPSPKNEKSRRKKRSLEEPTDTVSAEKVNIEKTQPQTENQDYTASADKDKTEQIIQPSDEKDDNNEPIKKEEKETQYRESDAIDETDGGYSGRLSSSLNNYDVKEEPAHRQRISDGYAQGRPNSPGNSVSSSYREFREVMDRNLGFQVERSSQTGCCTENEINQPISNKTFTRETHPVQCQMPIDSEEALKYLKLFLDSHKGAHLGEQTLTTVRSAAHQLITKVSVHKKSAGSIGEEQTSGTVYKDPESTPVNSQLQTESFEPTTMRCCVEQGRYHYQNCPNEQLWQTNEDYQNHTQYQEIMARSLTPPADFVDNEQYPYNDMSQMPTNEQYLEDVPELPIEYNDGYEEAAYQPEINSNLATTAPCDYTYDNSYYRQDDVNQNNYSPRFRNTREEPCCSMDILPIKGILKPCRTMENNEQVCCDLTTKRRTSTVSFENEDHINTQTETLLSCTSGQQQIDHKRNENFQTVVTRSENMQPLMECSELRETAYTTGQFLCPDNRQNEIDLCYDVDNTNNQFLYTVDSPSFRQCPCMLATYLKMLETYYRAGNT